MTPTNPPRPAVRIGRAAEPNLVEYAVLFLVVVAGVLTYLR